MFIQENDRSKKNLKKTFDNINVKHRCVLEVVLKLFWHDPVPTILPKSVTITGEATQKKKIIQVEF